MAEAAENTVTQEMLDKRERSSIEFPYMGLQEAIEVAQAIHRTTGSGLCQMDQLAAALGLSMASSGFRVRTATTKMFGLIDSERGSGAVRLTDLGHRIVDGSQERSAKVEAFLSVPLYRKLVEIHRGKTLPPPAALERVMAELGVAKKQTDRARQTFDRSAQAAGFFEFGRDKLVQPATGGGAPPAGGGALDIPEGGTLLGSAKGDGAPLRAPRLDAVSLPDPLMDALIKKLPAANTAWGVAERVTWLRMMEMAFTLAYGPVEAIKVSGAKDNQKDDDDF